MKYHTGYFVPKNIYKYKGDHTKIYHRSGLEKKFMILFDKNPSVMEWNSESIIIPYYSTVDRKKHRYFPDFYAKLKTKDGEKIVISIQNDREWSIFAENILRQPDLTQDPRFENNISRVENLKDLETEIAQVFKNWNAEYMYERLKEFGIAFGRLNSV